MTVPLNKLCKLIVDCPHSTAPDEGTGYPLIRTPNIGKGFFDLEGVHRVSEPTYNKRNARAIPQDGDLILAREAPAGNVAIIQNGRKFCLGQRTVLVRPDPEKVNPLWLNYYLNAPEQQHALLKNANGATVSHVNMPIIRNLPINRPDDTSQRRIAGILSAYDELIENNRKQIKLLEEAAQRLYKEWFIDFKFPGHETTHIDSAMGLPMGWENTNLLPLIDYIRGQSYSAVNLVADGPMNLINLNNIQAWGGWNAGAEKPYEGKCKKEQCAMSGDILMAVTDMTMERRLVGHVARVPNHLNGGVFSMDLIKLVPKKLNTSYLYALLRYSGVAEVISLLANGTNVLHLKPDALSRIEVLVPDDGVQDSFADIIAPMLEKDDLLEVQIAAAQEARDRLLPKLMSAEIEV